MKMKFLLVLFQFFCIKCIICTILSLPHNSSFHPFPPTLTFGIKSEQSIYFLGTIDDIIGNDRFIKNIDIILENYTIVISKKIVNGSDVFSSSSPLINVNIDSILLSYFEASFSRFCEYVSSKDDDSLYLISPTIKSHPHKFNSMAPIFKSTNFPPIFEESFQNRLYSVQLLSSNSGDCIVLNDPFPMKLILKICSNLFTENIAITIEDESFISKSPSHSLVLFSKDLQFDLFNAFLCNISNRGIKLISTSFNLSKLFLSKSLASILKISSQTYPTQILMEIDSKLDNDFILEIVESSDYHACIQTFPNKDIKWILKTNHRERTLSHLLILEKLLNQNDFFETSFSISNSFKKSVCITWETQFIISKTLAHGIFIDLVISFSLFNIIFIHFLKLFLFIQ